MTKHHNSRQQRAKYRRRNQQKKLWFSVIICIGLALGVHHALGNPLLPNVETVSFPADEAMGQEGSTTPSETPREDENPEESGSKDDSQSSPADIEDATYPSVDGEDSQQPSKDEEELDSNEITFSFVGDILLGNNVGPILEENGFDHPYQNVSHIFQASDLTLANLETPITDRGEPQDKQYVYRSHPKVLPAFKEAGFDIVNLANNHILDYGTVGLVDTFRYLREAEIDFVGAGENIDEAFAPVIVEKQGMRIAVLGFSRVVPEGWWKADNHRPGVAPTYNYVRPVEEVKAAAAEADIVIVLAHWGIERDEMPNEDQIDLAHRYIDAGADLVIGSHPHVLQGFEQYKGKWIAYSLGNFIFTTNDNAQTWDSAILQATCDRAGTCDLQMMPVLTKWALPELLEGEEAERLIRHMNEISFDVEISADGVVTSLAGN